VTGSRGAYLGRARSVGVAWGVAARKVAGFWPIDNRSDAYGAISCPPAALGAIEQSAKNVKDRVDLRTRVPRAYSLISAETGHGRRLMFRLQAKWRTQVNQAP
jgi:hypothetical protein